MWIIVQKSCIKQFILYQIYRCPNWTQIYWYSVLVISIMLPIMIAVLFLRILHIFQAFAISFLKGTDWIKTFNTKPFNIFPSTNELESRNHFSPYTNAIFISNHKIINTLIFLDLQFVFSQMQDVASKMYFIQHSCIRC